MPVIVKMLDNEELIIYDATNYFATENHWGVEVGSAVVFFNKSAVKYIGFAAILRGIKDDRSRKS